MIKQMSLEDISELQIIDILNRSDQEELLILCLTNKKFQKICYEDKVLRRKVRIGLIWEKEFKNLSKEEKEHKLVDFTISGDLLRIQSLIQN